VNNTAHITRVSRTITKAIIGIFKMAAANEIFEESVIILHLRTKPLEHWQ
jgi:hypothetical protein